jgi:hypothetical protein
MSTKVAECGCAHADEPYIRRYGEPMVKVVDDGTEVGKQLRGVVMPRTYSKSELTAK